MSEVIRFPGNPPPGGYSEGYIDKLHSAAFRDLEHDLCECVSMSKIAADLVLDLDQRLHDGSISSEVFAAAHLHNMLASLKKHYYALWNGADRPRMKRRRKLRKRNRQRLATHAKRLRR